jgi:hypothetical protein
LRSPSKLTKALCSINAPIQQWSVPARWTAALVAIAICIWRAGYLAVHSQSAFTKSDSRYYLAMASGDYSQVVQPFASRQLGARLVAGIMHVLHCSVYRAFHIEAVASLVVMLAVVYFLLLQTTAPRWMLLAIACVPFWGTLLQDLTLPDLWFSALLSILLLFLAGEQLLLASLMMFPLMLSRESTSLTLVCFLIVAWTTLRWRDRLVAIASTVAGALVVGHLAARSQSNVEHLPEAVYMMTKVPWNFLHNILGILPWSNVNTAFCQVPTWSMSLHLGPIRSIGTCGFSTFSWEFIPQALLSIFGLLPVLVLFLWHRRQRSAQRSLLLRFTLLYGTVSLCLAPLLGVSFVHLIGYAWPLFLVALPMLFEELKAPPPTASRALAAFAFLCAHVWSAYVAYKWLWIPQITIEFMLWIIGYLLLRLWIPNQPTPHPAPAPQPAA